MNIWTVRIGAMAVALAISAVVFLFYGQFAMAMKRVMELPVVQPAAVHQSTDEVSVSLPPIPKTCPKGQTCK
jgi:hypothetical protein